MKGLTDPLMHLKIEAALLLSRKPIEVLKSAGSDSMNMPDWVISEAISIDSTLAVWEQSPLRLREELAKKLGFPPLSNGLPRASLYLSLTDIGELDSWIVAAAQAARKKTHHVLTNSECLRRRLMYSWNREQDHNLSKGVFTEEDYKKRTAAWFGVEPALWDKDGGATVEAEYRRFCNDIKAIDQSDREKLNSGAEWETQRSMVRYPSLYKVAQWHCAVATSSVPVERVFAYMRKMEAFDRLTMHEDSFDSELFFKCNKWIVDELYQEDLARMPTMKTGIDLFQQDVAGYLSGR